MGRFAMRPKERRDSGQKDLFRARLDQIVDSGSNFSWCGAKAIAARRILE
jgi:acetyl-CoA carboxylase carboxyltransferase component